MAETRTRLSKLPPMPVGRAIRVLLGIGTLYWMSEQGVAGLGLAGFAAVLFLGISFLLGGLNSNPGCELTAIPNLFLPKEEHVHFV